MKQEGSKAPTYDRHSTLTDVHANILRNAVAEIELDTDNFPQFAAVIQPLMEQLLPLTRELEVELERHGVDYPDRGMQDTHQIEDKMLELINYIAKLIHSLGAILENDSYSPHSKYGNKGVLVSSKTRQDLVPAIQIKFTPIQLRQFNSVESQDLGLSEAELKKSDSGKSRELRRSAEAALSQIDVRIRRIMTGWQTDLAQAASQKRQPGFTFEFGRVGQNGFEPNKNMRVQLRTEIRYAPHRGLHFVPVLQYSNPEIIDRGLDISVTGTPVGEKNNLNQLSVNALSQGDEIQRLGIQI